MLERLQEEWLDAAERTLGAHSKNSIYRGMGYFDDNKVEYFPTSDVRGNYQFLVHGTLTYKVTINFMEDDSCHVHCDCPVDHHYCKHTASALIFLIDFEEEMEILDSDNIFQFPAPKPKPQEINSPSELKRRLEEHLGRTLNKKQNAVVLSIQRVYLELKHTSSQPYGRHLNAAFKSHFFPDWESFNLWAEFPVDDHEFWLYLYHFAADRMVAIPPLLRPISDLSRIETKLQAWRRSQTIREWEGFFRGADSSIGRSQVHQAAPSSQELQLRFGPQEAVLEWRQAPNTPFVRIPSNALKQLNHSLNYSRSSNLSPLSELLVRRIAGPERERLTQKIKYDSYETDSILSGILQQPSLTPILISPSGEPFERPATEAQWRLEPDENNPESDYRLQLIVDDSPSPERPFYIVDGDPAYALTSKAIIRIPTTPNISVTRLINNPTLPVEAVESPHGIRSFANLKAALPKHLEDRVHHTPLKIRILCELEQASREECHITVQAITPDETVVARWNGYEWSENRHTLRDSSLPGDQITVYDDAPLAAAQSLFHSIKTTPHPHATTLVLPVNRTFPEQFSNWLQSIPPNIEVLLNGELAAFNDPTVVGKMKVEVEDSDEDWFDLKVVFDISDTDLTAQEIKLLLKANGKWVRFKGKGWRRLDYEFSEEEDREFARLGLNPHELSDTTQRFHALQLANPSAKQLLPDAQAQAVQRRATEIQTRVTPAKPRGIKASLRPYQKEGFHFLAYLSSNRFGGILADDMGLGKTLQTLTWLVWLRTQQEEKAAPSLVVCPKSVMDNWGVETEKFAPNLKIKIWAASAVQDLPKHPNDADIHVINYTHLRSIGDQLKSTPFLAVILDEGQYIKNPSSQAAKTARSLQAQHRLVLTGTPIENRALDLWSLMSFAMPGVLGNQSQFSKLYDSKKDPLSRLRLSSRVRPFLIRRTKNQVAQDLPERIEDEIHCEIEGGQRTLYDAELKRAQQILLGVKTKKQLNKVRFNFLTSLLRLRQICAHPRLHHKTSRASAAKVTALIELLEPIMEEGAKVLVFSQFVELIKILETELAKHDIKTWTLTGSTEDRGALVKQFKDSKDPGVFLISLKAGGSGLNLEAASYVVLFDPWWNPAVEAQAIDRTHRIGQTSRIIAYRLVIKNSIEEKIRSLQKKKQALAADVLGDEKFSQSLSLKDFQYLLED